MENGSGRDLPAIALTAYASADDRRHALDAGFQEHVTKPIDPSRLVDAIARLTHPCAGPTPPGEKTIRGSEELLDG
jgi:CheY-like chemotaxis protein